LSKVNEYIIKNTLITDMFIRRSWKKLYIGEICRQHICRYYAGGIVVSLLQRQPLKPLKLLSISV